MMMRSKKYISPIVLVLAVLLSSCGIYGSYQRPKEITVDRLFRSPIAANDTLVSSDSTSIGSLPWRTFFTDPYLQDLIEVGLEKNVDLNVAKLTLEQAKATLLTSGLSLLPNLGFAPSANRQYIENSGWTEVKYALPITSTWEVDLFMKQGNTLRQAQAEKRQAEARVQLVQTNIIATIANSYYTLLMLDEQERIAQETVVLWERNSQTMEALKRSGRTTEAAVAQAKAQSLAVQNTLLGIQKQIREVESSLSLLLHQPPQAISRSSLGTQKVPDGKLNVGLPVYLLANRPDVRVAEEQVAIAYYGANRARASFLPGISITASGSWTNNVGNVIVDPMQFIGNAVASLFQPIFNQGKNVAQLRVAKARQKQSTLLLQQTLLEAGAEVSDLLYAYQTFTKQIEIRKEQVTTLERAKEVTQKLMNLGNSTYLEVLSAQNQLLAAQLTLTSEQFGQVQTLINLYKALGGGRY